MKEGHEQRRAIDHGRVDHLTLACALRMPERGKHAHEQQHRAAAVVAHEIERWRRGLITASNVREHARHGDVVEVVAGAARPGALLAPPGHAPIDERRASGQGGLRRQAEALHHTRAEALDEHMRFGDEVEDELPARVLPNVDDDTGAATARDVAQWIPQHETGPGGLDPDALGAKIGEHHRGEGCRPDASHLDETQTGQGSPHLITTMTWVLNTASRPSGVHSSRVSVA